MVYRKKEYLAREQDAPTGILPNKHCRTMHDHYNAPPPLPVHVRKYQGWDKHPACYCSFHKTIKIIPYLCNAKVFVCNIMSGEERDRTPFRLRDKKNFSFLSKKIGLKPRLVRRYVFGAGHKSPLQKQLL